MAQFTDSVSIVYSSWIWNFLLASVLKRKVFQPPTSCTWHVWLKTCMVPSPSLGLAFPARPPISAQKLTQTEVKLGYLIFRLHDFSYYNKVSFILRRRTKFTGTCHPVENCQNHKIYNLSNQKFNAFHCLKSLCQRYWQINEQIARLRHAKPPSFGTVI